MAGVCGMNQGPTRLWRNGLEFEPKKTYPPDYSNVPNVRDWQMSPFGRERFDLDEIQRAEKKGFKGRFELERLKKLYGMGQTDPCNSKPPSPPPCEECKARARAGTKKKARCSSDILYQPYGPVVLSSVSYNRPELGKPRMYSYLGPSFYAGFRFKTPAPEMMPTVPCSDISPLVSKSTKNVYIPYGPYGELRITPDLYTPMGPSIIPLNLAF